MARDPQHFSQRGVSTKTLESASRARQAFYLSGWKGAKILINNEESRFERTPFFETLIKRGLQQSTSFIIESLTAAEQKLLGIQFDAAAGTHFLTQFRKGSASALAAAAAPPAPLTIKPALKMHATRRTNKKDSSSTSSTAAVVVPPSPPARATAATTASGLSAAAKKKAAAKRKPRSRGNSIDAAASAKEAALAEAAARVKTEAATHMRR
jgi:hypothetical protein